ncbi:MAG: penicillin-binding protein 2 [Pseudomonadota bacterium]
MANLQAIKDTAAEQRLFFGRLLLALIGVLVGCGVVLARLTQLQVVEHDQYAALAQSNRIRVEAAPPTRGLILDRNGVVLAQNLPAYQLEMIPEQVPDIDAALDALLADGLLDPNRVDEVRERIRRTAKFNPVTLKSRMDDQEIARFAMHRPYFPGIDIRARLIRDYPHGKLAAHVIGYVGGLSPQDLARIDQADYAGTSQIGKTGIELQYESLLHGSVGHNHVQTTAEGRAIASEVRDQPTPGKNIYLTLDIELQRLAEAQLDGRRGSIVAIDPNNGEVLAMASSPAYDPNSFARGISQRDYTALQENLDRPLFNRSIAGRYPPGSTIKPMLGFGALISGRTSTTRTINCEGFFSLPGSTHRYRDWKPEGHGLVDLRDSIAQSCDVYFYQLAQDMDIDLMHDHLVNFGLGSATGIEIPGEKNGIVPSREWKRQNFQRRADRVWFPGETVIASIGQGYMLATPLQLAHATATLSMRGIRMRPHLTMAVADALSNDMQQTEPESLPSIPGGGDEHTWQHIIDAMQDVLQSPRGSAYATGVSANYTIAGKSGTAQVFTVAQEEKYDDLELDERLKDHALFIAFAPIEAPTIAVAVVIENGSSGSSVAAPVAKALTDLWLTRSGDAP